MKQNVGEADKAIRVIIGTLVLFWGLYNRNVLGLVGVVLLTTAFVGFCPLYSVLGFSTGEKSAPKAVASSVKTPKAVAKKKVAKKSAPKKAAKKTKKRK